MSLKNIVIAIPLEENLLTPLYSWGQRFSWQQVEAVTLLHVVKKNITPLEFGLVEMPDEKTYREMVPTLERFLQEEARKILGSKFQGKINYLLSRDYNPEEETIEALKKIKPDLVVVATQGKHGFEGLFHSSFTDHMVRFAPCDVYVVRP
jgi:nucleotide-binding universal stress UspA family protein